MIHYKKYKKYLRHGEGRRCDKRPYDILHQSMKKTVQHDLFAFGARRPYISGNLYRLHEQVVSLFIWEVKTPILFAFTNSKMKPLADPREVMLWSSSMIIVPVFGATTGKLQCEFSWSLVVLSPFLYTVYRSFRPYPFSLVLCTPGKILELYVD